MQAKNKNYERWILKLLFENNFQKFIDAGKIWIENECDKQNIEIIDYSFILGELINFAWRYKREGEFFDCDKLIKIKKRVVKNMILTKKAIYLHSFYIEYNDNILNQTNYSYLNSCIKERISFSDPKIFQNMKNQTVIRYFLLQQNFRKHPHKKIRVKNGIFF